LWFPGGGTRFRGAAAVGAHSSAEEHSVYTRAVAGSNPAAPTGGIGTPKIAGGPAGITDAERR
jgi:hypothetical protein